MNSQYRFKYARELRYRRTPALCRQNANESLCQSVASINVVQFVLDCGRPSFALGL